jgi:hypothetical protein
MTKGTKVRTLIDIAHSTWPTTRKPTQARTIRVGTLGVVQGVQQGTGLLVVKFEGHSAPKFGLSRNALELV